MTSLRILHVDDEPDIREVVEISLSLDPAFSVRSVASGAAALAAVAEWPPDLILCDVMMPVMDGPTTLARLRAQPATARIPLVFMTARAQSREIEQFKALGATGVIPKPFDPMTLAGCVRSQLRSAGIDSLRDGFLARLRTDAVALKQCREALAGNPGATTVLGDVVNFAHALAGAAGIFGFHEVGERAAKLEKAATARLDEGALPGPAEQALEGLLAAIPTQ